MIKVSESNQFFNVELSNKHEYEHCISDLVQNQMVKSLDGFVHHRNVSRLDHCVHVSYLSYLVCKKLGLDYLSAARGGLLHDFYFYNSRATVPDRGIHCFCHASIALENATRQFPLNEVEKDIILKHMWPLTLRPPKFKESYVVTFMDKYCASKEFALYNGNITLPANLFSKLHNYHS